MSIEKKLTESNKCYHCGDDCPDSSISVDDKSFCCQGCKTVYEILNENQLCNYYDFDQNPGISPKYPSYRKFDFLDDPEVIRKLIDFKDDKIIAVTFFIPQMHCSSCIWLLENLYKINDSVFQSTVDFLKKQINIKFNHSRISLKEVVQLLTSIGYEPQINLDSVEKKAQQKSNKKLYYKIGIAAFCFGNIMLLSFPEYLSIDVSDIFFIRFFGYLNLILALPVFFYSASEYFVSAYKGLKKKIVNIDFPVSLGILVLFIRSVYEVLSHTGAGYFDSLTGLVFFLLIGKLFQEKTYDSLNFERNYKSYFPLSVLVKKKEKEKAIPVSDLKIGDRIIVRKNEIIPADSILFKGNGSIDYSFVTGESKPVIKVLGELIYAGGKQTGPAIELEVIKEVSQSYLTQLWDNEAFDKNEESGFTVFTNRVSKYFTFVVLAVAFISSALWLSTDINIALNVFTAVLIVACPCALALSTPFTLGNTLRIFGRNKFYLKNSSSIEKLAKINTVVFDKTGTITKSNGSQIRFVGSELNRFQKEMIKTVVKNSTHPLSRMIFDSIKPEQELTLTGYEEYAGNGIEGEVMGNKIKLGSRNFIDKNALNNNNIPDRFDTRVYLSINDKTLGYYEFINTYREGIAGTIKNLNQEYDISLLSGDNEAEKENLKEFFIDSSKLFFRQSPEEKLKYVKSLQSSGKNVLMIGDGLNDAGALKQSNAGISVTENISSFSPACDAILEADKLNNIFDFIKFSKTSVRIILASFGISFLYNLIGLGFAVDGLLSPIVAAILMPASSISVVLFATLSTNLLAKKRGLLSL